MTKYKDQKTTIFSELCSLYESNDTNFYNILDSIVEIMNQDQLEQLEDIIVNQYQEDWEMYYEEGLWEYATNKAYEMMKHRRDSLDDETFDYQILYWTKKVYHQNSHLRGID